MIGFNLINTNARSLHPKVPSLLRNFSELELSMAIITETWFSQGERLEKDSEDLLLGSGLAIKTRNRQPGRAGFSHGGVAIVMKDSISKMKVVEPVPNAEEFEVLTICSPVSGQKRRLYVIAVYIPPGYNVARGRGCMQFVSDTILEIKDKADDPLICVAGDFNQWGIEDYLADYPDLVEVETGPTRNQRRIDRVFLNWDVASFSCHEPLQTEPDDEGNVNYSDHRVQLVETTIPARDGQEWVKYSYRPFSQTAADNFKAKLSSVSWQTVNWACGSNNKQKEMQRILDDLMDEFFPWKTVRKKEDDLPWLNDTARKKIKKKKAVYKDEGKSDRWEAIRLDLETYLERRREKYLENQRSQILGPLARANFHKNVRNYKSFEKPKEFNIRELRPDSNDQEIADEAAEYFNRISKEFSPLMPSDIPKTYERPLPFLTCEMVQRRLESCKKPNSMVRGDIFPKLVKPCSEYLSVPLSYIYNEIMHSFVWPIEWKREYVTAIPKKSLPADFSDLRNISCTNLFSKVFESFVLQFAQEEISLKKNQYGGVKGCSTSHLLIDLMQEIFENGEDYRSATVITAIDYSKAFNRMSFQECLKALEKKGASSTIIRLIATFLTNRTMTLRVGDKWSVCKEVHGGCPQGSILGVFLFNVTTDDLEDDFVHHEHERLGLPIDEPEQRQLDRGEPEQVAHQVNSPPAASHLSTPTRPVLPPLGADLSPIRGYGTRPDVVFNENARNLPFGWTQPPEEVKVGTQVLTKKPVKIVKYIDDNLIIEKVNFGNVDAQDGPSGPIKKKVSIGIQNAFRSIVKNAKKKRMQVNAAKTNMLCISDSLNYRPVTFFRDEEGNTIDCVEKMKILGFHLSNRPGVGLHVEEVCKSLRMKNWSIRHLKKLGFNKEELVRMYGSVIVPSADYCDVVYHSSLTDEQDQALERAQVGALRAIFGYGISGRKMRGEGQVKTLRERRIEHCDKFANKCAGSARFGDWFPLRTVRRATRGGEMYHEYQTKTDRLKNSPLYYMRRRLNGKEGKQYGERYRIYREDGYEED